MLLFILDSYEVCLGPIELVEPYFCYQVMSTISFDAFLQAKISDTAMIICVWVSSKKDLDVEINWHLDT